MTTVVTSRTNMKMKNKIHNSIYYKAIAGMCLMCNLVVPFFEDDDPIIFRRSLIYPTLLYSFFR